MKPILHIINNPDDTQAIETIRIQGKDNAYGVAAVFTGEIPSGIPSMPDVRLCVLREDAGLKISPPANPTGSGEGGKFEFIGYDDLLNLIFSVESITVW